MRRIAFTIMLVAAIAILKLTEAQAQTSSATPGSTAAPVEQTVKTKQAAPAVPANNLLGTVRDSASPLSGTIATGYSSNLYERTAVESQSFVTYSSRLDYRVGKTSNLVRAVLSGYKEDQGAQENKLNDGFLAWVNGTFWRKGNVTSLGQQIRFAAPASKESVKRDEKLTGVTVAPMAIFNLTPVGLLGVSLVMQTQATKNFHKYEQNRAGGNNTSMALSQVVSLNWSITDQIYWRNDFVYGLAWSYGGIKRNDAYQFASEAGYCWSSGVCYDLGLSNSGAVRNLENGNDQTIQLFNNKTASVYTDLSYSF